MNGRKSIVKVKKGTGIIVGNDYEDDTEEITRQLATSRRSKQTLVKVILGTGIIVDDQYEGKTEIILRHAANARESKSRKEVVKVLPGTLHIVNDTYQGKTETISKRSMVQKIRIASLDPFYQQHQTKNFHSLISPYTRIKNGDLF